MRSGAMASRPLPDSVWLIAALLAVAAAVALLGMIPNTDSMTAGFSLLILVLLTAAFAPIWIANTVAVASTLSFNYFFFPPLGTFSFTKPQDSISLLAFLVTAIVSTKVSAGAPVRSRDAGALLTSLSHELKTPLTAMLFAIENLRVDLPTVERRAQADAALTELSRLTQLFEGPHRPDA
jgi:K+-sensing histidine kinase KdpD